MRCLFPRYVSDGVHPGSISVPCGRCRACRVNKTTEWSTRVLCELPYFGCSSFITLTFDDSHYGDPSLSKRDLQLFFKRVRKMFPDSECKYVACGEYGPSTMRKHYHAIVLGLDFKPWSLHHYENGHPIFVSDSLSALWPFGYSTVDEVNESDINYVAGYIRKKLSGPAASVYRDSGLLPPFQLQSKGLGARYADDHCDRLASDLCIYKNGRARSIPRYMKKRIGLCDVIPDVGLSPMQIKALEISSKNSDEFASSRYCDLYDYEFLYRRDARLQKNVELESKEQLFAARDKI